MSYLNQPYLEANQVFAVCCEIRDVLENCPCCAFAGMKHAQIVARSVVKDSTKCDARESVYMGMNALNVGSLGW